MSFSLWSRLFPRSRPASAARRPRQSPPCLESLETRALPSGGHGPSSLLAVLPDAPSTPALVPPGTQQQSGKGGGQTTGLRLDDTPPPPGSPLHELFSGYPIPPSGGPAPTGSFLVGGVSALPFAQQGSILA